MKMLLDVEMPLEPFNTLTREGKVGQVIGRVLEDIKPEVVYFTERDGLRGCILVVDLKDASDVARLAEPFFLNFNASCKFRVAMSPEDLRNANLEDLGKKWA